MTTAYAWMVEVVENAEIGTMPFEWLQEGWEIVAFSGLLGKEAAGIHSVIWGHTDKSFGGGSLSRCAVD